MSEDARGVQAGLPRPGLRRFWKGHGTENDFVLLPDPDGALDLAPALVRALCDRRAGIGGDGVLRVVRTAAATGVADLPEVAGAQWFMDYHNADGSLAQMCGNGVRVYVRYLLEEGLIEPGTVLLATRGGIRKVEVNAAGAVVVDMGAPEYGRSARATLAGVEYTGTRVSMGNPHLVCVIDGPIDTLDLSRAPQVDPAAFPEGVNVEFVRVDSPGHLTMRVHERGVGETRSCGTGAVAAAAAVAGDAPNRLGAYTVDVPGGRLTVTLTERTALLGGPAVLVGTGELSARWWEWASGTDLAVLPT